MKALILAAGYATRLYPLTRNFPKPLLDVGGRPMLDLLMKSLRPLGFSEILVVSNRKLLPHFEAWAKDMQGHTPPLTILDDGSLTEDDRLGAIGDMAFAVKTARIQEPLLVIAGDNLFDFSLEPFMRDFQKRTNPLVGLYEYPKWNHLSKYGIVTLDSEDRFVELVEKPKDPKSNLVSMCLYAFPADSLPWLEAYLSGTDPKDAPGNYIRWLMTKTTVFGHRFQGVWLDIGDLDSLQDARKIFG